MKFVLISVFFIFGCGIQDYVLLRGGQFLSFRIYNGVNNIILTGGCFLGTAPEPVYAYIDSSTTPLAASGNPNWKLQIPTSLKEGRHFIRLGYLSNGQFYEKTSFYFVKGLNRDLNGDGYPDLAVTIAGTGTSAGAVAIYYSKGSTGFATTPDTILADPAATANDNFGYTISMADLNGDGRGDLIVGAPGTTANQGAAYIFNGATSGISSSPDLTITAPAGGRFSASLFAGDMTGDGYFDIWVGAYQASAPNGIIYSYHSQGSTGLPTVPTVTSLTGHDALGLHVLLGDTTGDGYTDGLAWDQGPGGINVKVYPSQGASGLPTNYTAQIFDPQVTTFFGSTMTGGDLNADGYADAVIGAYNYNSSQGVVYLYYSQGASGLPSSPNTTLTKPSPVNNDLFGAAETIGDFDGNGYADLAIGVPGQNGNEGAVFIYYQSSSGFASPVQLVISGAGRLGGQLFPGDFNVDGFMDLAVSACATNANNGNVYVFYGSSSGLSTTNSTTLSSPYGGAMSFGQTLPLTTYISP